MALIAFYGGDHDEETGEPSAGALAGALLLAEGLDHLRLIARAHTK